MIVLAEMSSGLEWFLAALMLLVGACIGSFLNVVVYRLPAGLNIARPPSYCPLCKHPIRARDNIPVVGWLLLRGRCRDCSAAISVRYPAVETLIAAIFLLLFLSEIHFGVATLPTRPTSSSPPLLLSPSPPLLLWSSYAFHLLLISTLTAATLIQYDRKRVPWTLYAPAWIVGAFAPIYWVALHPVPLAVGVAADTWETGMFEGVVGFAVGALLGAIGSIEFTSNRPADGNRPTALWAASLIGLFLGWQAVATIAAVSAVLSLIVALAARVKKEILQIPPAAYLTGMAVCYIMVWRWTIDRWTWLGSKAGWLTLLELAALVLVVSLVRSFIAPGAGKKKQKR